jgi:hypothetical protein
MKDKKRKQKERKKETKFLVHEAVTRQVFSAFSSFPSDKFYKDQALKRR